MATSQNVQHGTVKAIIMALLGNQANRTNQIVVKYLIQHQLDQENPSFH